MSLGNERVVVHPKHFVVGVMVPLGEELNQK